LIEASEEKGFQTKFNNWGWGHQVSAPGDGLMSVWETGARVRNRELLDWIEESMPQTCITRFTYADQESPTSWHLTEKEKRLVAKQWESRKNQAHATGITEWLNSSDGICPGKLSADTK